MITGTCHCQKISFEIDADKLSIRYCYCETCRKLSGADYSSVARVERGDFSISDGEDSLVM